MKKLVAPPLIADMIRALIPSGCHADIIALFEHRASLDIIKGWRKGRRPTPQWAIDLCVQRLAHGARLMERARKLPQVDGRRTISAANILAWNERRAKEKAGSKPASSPSSDVAGD